MNSPTPVNPLPPSLDAPEASPSDVFDYKLVKDYVGFVLGGVRRHRWIALAAFIGTAILGITAALIMPKTFRVESKILAQRNVVMQSMGNPHRAVPLDA